VPERRGPGLCRKVLDHQDAGEDQRGGEEPQGPGVGVAAGLDGVVDGEGRGLGAAGDAPSHHERGAELAEGPGRAQQGASNDPAPGEGEGAAPEDLELRGAQGAGGVFHGGVHAGDGGLCRLHHEPDGERTGSRTHAVPPLGRRNRSSPGPVGRSRPRTRPGGRPPHARARQPGAGRRGRPFPNRSSSTRRARSSSSTWSRTGSWRRTPGRPRSWVTAGRMMSSAAVH
jgi:hypothetical protein